MKRSAAIIGPTPQFVRWAIAHPCPLRELDLEALPETTFRQLRAARALSDGFKDGRIFEGVCVHPTVDMKTSAETARGFPIDEVFEVFGSEQVLDECCGTCPANALGSGTRKWAGCYGWLPSSSTWDINTASEPNNDGAPPCEDLPQMFEDAIKLNHLEPYKLAFENHVNFWHGIWQPLVLSGTRLRVLREVLEDLFVSKSEPGSHFEHLVNAIKCCVESELSLHVELVPRGYSDGSHWTIVSNCPDCKAAQEPGIKTCSGCGRVGSPAESRKLKVLGFHPFLLLRHLWGLETTSNFVERYAKRKI